MHRRLLLLAAMAVLITSARPVANVAQPTSCVVTEPPNPPFIPPFPAPAVPPMQRMFWYGNDDLWTWLPLDGRVGRREKSIWWHPGFYPRIEPKPDLRVVATELETRTRVVAPGAGNAFANEDGGWTMMTMLGLPVAGCWVVTATYHGAKVNYVVAVD